MVLVANKKTQIQMKEDLQLFLHQHTDVFTAWLGDILNKLKQVTKNPKPGTTHHWNRSRALKDKIKQNKTCLVAKNQQANLVKISHIALWNLQYVAKLLNYQKSF